MATSSSVIILFFTMGILSCCTTQEILKIWRESSNQVDKDDITVPESGAYVVMVTYVHPERFIHRVFITVGDQRGTMEILPCRYQFLCRQFAMDGNKRPKTYEFMARQTSKVTIESSASAKIGVVSSLCLALS